MLPLFVVGLGFTFLAIIFITCIISPTTNTPSNLPPGKTGWPVIGENARFVMRPEKFIHERMSTRSADVFLTSLAGEKMVVFCGSMANKFIYSNENKLVGPWLPISLVELLTSRYDSAGLEEDVHTWLRMDSMKNYIPIMDTKVKAHLEARWAPFKEVKAYDVTREFTLTLGCAMFLNWHDVEQVMEMAPSFFEFSDGVLSAPINFPGTRFYNAMKASKVVQSRLTEIIRRRKLEIIMMEESVKSKEGWKRDMLDMLLTRLMENGENNIKDEEIAKKIRALLFAGFHPSSITLTFFVNYLAQYPHVYQRVLQEQMEIAKGKGEGEMLNWKDIQKMKYSWNVVCETMRLRSPATGGFREALVDFTYKGFTIPKGWKIHWSVYSTSKDPEVFPDPEKFDPDRFERGKFPPNTFVPFGGGPRTCCGREYARTTILVFIHNVVTRFKFHKLNPNEKVIYDPNPKPADGLPIRLEPRRN